MRDIIKQSAYNSLNLCIVPTWMLMQLNKTQTQNEISSEFFLVFPTQFDVINISTGGIQIVKGNKNGKIIQKFKW